MLQTLKAVAWSFIGIRKSADHAADTVRLNPVHVIIAGLVMAAVFIFTLITIVHWVVG
ncbi:MAG: DUF2970 domain-containing protein [Burkholderiaceae bacterium]